MSLEIAYVEDTGAPEVDLDYLQETERRVGHEFDPEYVEFIRIQNGGVPIKKYFKAGKHKKAIDKFLCMVSDYETSEHGDADVGIVWSQYVDAIGEHLVPFASVVGGDFVCFDYEDRLDVPAVVFWNKRDSVPGRPELVPLASNFRKFLGTLSKL